MNQPTRDALRSALFEAAFVVLGVVVALGANEWRGARADRIQSEQAIETIIEEIQNNRATVAGSIEYHEGLLKELRAEHEPGWQPGFALFKRGFVSPATISRTAWESASETGALAKTEFGRVIELSSAYSLQQRYEDQTRIVAEILFAEIFHNGATAVLANYRNLTGTIESMVYSERKLVAQFDGTLAAIVPETN